MKRITLLFAFIMSVVVGFTQTQIYSDNFDSYTAGQKLAQQASGEWTTWSGTTGNSEDPAISSSVSHSSPNSANVVTNNDLVLLFGDKTTGRYQLEFYMYVTTNKVAYFNLLQDFAGANSLWGMQAFFNVDGTATVDANGASAGTFSFAHNSWIYINLIVDVDDDFATMYVDNQEVVSWIWSLGSFGDGTLAKLDAANFYGWSDDNGNGCSFYIDDLVFTEQVQPEAPSSLSASVNGLDIDLTWTVPGGPAPDNYSLVRNSAVYNTSITQNSYTDINLYPGTYDYYVKAHYDGLGYSPSSNMASGEIGGGVSRNVVLFEIVTGTWCGYCPGSAMGADDMVQNGHKVAIIEYHGGDSYEIPASTSRIGYYNVTGYPTTCVDGEFKLSGGSATTSLYPSYLPWYNEKVDIPGLHTIDLNIVHNGAGNFTADVTVNETSGYFPNDLKLHAVLTESHIPEAWQNQTELNFVCRAMYPDENGVDLDFSGSSTHNETYNFTVSPSYTLANCEFIVFIQHNTSKQIVQSVMVDMQDIPLSIDDVDIVTSAVYPNPASGTMNVACSSGDIVKIMDLLGNNVGTFVSSNSIETIDISGLSRGVYYVEIQGKSVEKVVVQ